MAIAFVDAVAIRENVVRVEFSEVVSLTGLLETTDASRPELWDVAADTSTTGMSGDAARPVTVVLVEYSGEEDGVEEEDEGRFVNLILDRPMTPYPADYVVSWEGIYAEDLATFDDGEATISGVYRFIDAPTIEVPRRSRDFANPQTLAAAREALAVPEDPYALGTFGLDASGDYAHDEGNESLKKRVIRRLLTRKGAFAHLPNYGVGVPDETKRLGTAETLSRLKVDAESQIAEEPDVEKVRVVIVTSASQPDLVRFRVAIKPKGGPAIAFDVPFDRAA